LCYNFKPMEVKDIGEFGLIERLAKITQSPDKSQSSWQKLLVGIGDDAAAWQGDSSIELATTDSLIQDVHFTLESITFHELGWKAMAANLSDIAAMGGIARYALVSLALPHQSKLDDITALYQGMAELAEKFGVAIIGGDTSRAPLVMITVTILGSTKDSQQPLTRSSAQVGDRIAVSGYLGGASAGEEMLRKKLGFGAEVSASLKKAFLCPNPRVTEGQLLLEGGVKAAIDLSDGLVSDLVHICQASRVNARIEVDSVPIHPAVKDSFGPRAIELALGGGEDYELLFTAKDEVISRVTRAVSCPITTIGEITSQGKGEVSLVDRKGQPLKLETTGWEHFGR